MESNEGLHSSKARQSGIETLKVIAILFIVLSHIIQTLCSANTYITYSDYILNLSDATLNISMIGLQFLRSFGAWGNLIFFVCSAWFLLDSNRVNSKKWFYMLLEVWVISILFTIVTTIVLEKQIPLKLLVKCLFPTTFANNWYMTCYLLFYPLHTLLNKLLDSIDQRMHFRLALAGFFVFFGANFISSGLFFASSLTLWMGIYTIVSYMKKYMKGSIDNIKANFVVLLISVGLFFVFQIVWNLIGTRFSFIYSKMLRWNSNNNPFWLISSLCMLNISRNLKLKNKSINYISSLSLLIYLIHENILLRTYFRPYIFEHVYHLYGYGHIYLIVFAYTIALFLASLICAVLYKITIGQVVKVASNSLQSSLQKRYTIIENKLIKQLYKDENSADLER